MDRDILTLQETLAHQQADMAKMSDELYVQQQELAALRSLCKSLQMRIEELAAQTAGAGGENEPPPPHY